MNKLLKVTLITAIMATSGMACGGDITRGSQSPIQNQCCEMMTKGALCAAAAYTAHKALCGECQHTTFDADSEYSQDYTISGNTWITRVADGDTAVITGDVKIKDGSRWKHDKGEIVLTGKGNIIDNSELVINDGEIVAYDTGKLDIKDRSSILVKGYGRIVADGNNNSENGATINVDRSTISMKDIASIGADNNSTINVNKSTISMKDGAYIGADNNSTINVNKSTISMKDGADIEADDNSTINVDKSTISMKDSASICVYPYGTININEDSIFDARDSKDLSNWNTFGGTFNMLSGSIMYLPSTDIGDDKKANSGLWPFIITLPSEGDKPVELRYIQHTDITLDGLCPNVTHSGCNYKLSDWEKGTDNDISYLQEPNTGIKFTWEGINENTNAIPPSIAKLVPIYTWSVSTKCDGEDVKILESRDLQCCDDILW